MIEPTDADIAEALRLIGFKETLANEVRDWPQDFPVEWEVARTLAKLRVAMEALESCRAQFDFYASEHRKAEKHEKAATNEKFAFLCSQALAQIGARQ